MVRRWYVDVGRLVPDAAKAWVKRTAERLSEHPEPDPCLLEGCVGFDLDATIAWRRRSESSTALRDVLASLEHGQMADWLVELRNLRRLVLDVPVVDRLRQAWDDQVAFMRLLQARRGFPDFPVDLRTKEGQRLVKEIAYDACHELHEAVDHLKNAKLHRATEVPELDRAAFLEELVDAFKFIVEVAVLAGVSLDEFFAAYEKKTERNTRRIAEEGY